MTRQLDGAIERRRRPRPTDQDRIAGTTISGVERDERVEIDPDDLPHLLEGLAQAERGEFVSDVEVERIFRRFER